MLQDTSDMNLIIFQGVGEYEDIIEIDHYKDISHVSEDVVHQGLECSRSIDKSHWHDQELKGAIAHSEGHIPLVACCDTIIVVASMEVKLGVDLHAAQLVKEVGDERDWVPILLCDLVEVSEVDTALQGAILLLGKEDGCTTWRLRQSDEPLAEHVVEELMKETELCAREWVDVAMGRCLVILEVNFMIKLTMRGHVLSLFSQEHIEKVLVGLRDDFGEKFCLISREGLRVQSGCWSGLVANGSQGCNIQIIASQLDINGVYFLTCIN